MASCGTERVQIVLKGQRFEAERAALERHCAFFARYFAKSSDEPPPPGDAAYTVEQPTDGRPFHTFRFPTVDPEFMGALLVYFRKGKVSFVFEELSAEQQARLTELVRLFGIESLAKTCGAVAPTAVADADRRMQWGTLPREGLVGKALEYAELQRQEQQQRGGNSVARGPNPPHSSINDQELALPSTGCAFCGISGHDAAMCPHNASSSH